MLVVDLACVHGHPFEGWFASSEDLASQKARGLLSCPVCGERDVTRRPSAPHLNTSHLKGEAPRRSQEVAAPSIGQGAAARAQDAHTTAGEAQKIMTDLHALYLKAVRHVVEHTEDVGERFADEARSMHYGELPERAIRGKASAEEREALKEEGIDVLALPIPDALKGPLQ